MNTPENLLDRTTGLMQRIIIFCGVAVALAGIMWKSLKSLFRVGKAIDQVGRMYHAWEANGGEFFYARQNDLYARMMPGEGRPCAMQLIQEMKADVEALKKHSKTSDATREKILAGSERMNESNDQLVTESGKIIDGVESIKKTVGNGNGK